MQTHRIISGLTIFLMVALIAIGYFVIAQPQLAAANTATDQLVGVNSQIAASQSTINQLKGEQAKLPALKEQLASLRESVPTDAQISRYIEGLNSLATASGVSITGITVASAMVYTPPANAAPAPAATTATPTPTPSASASAAAAPAIATGPTAWIPTTDPSITATNFVAIPVTVTLSGSTPNVLAFIKGLQTGTRLFLVGGVSTAADTTTPGAVTGTVTGYIYVLLDAAAPKTTTADGTSTTTSTPIATTTPTATTSPSGTATPTPTQSPTPTTKP